jgi:hypothetical protein
MSERQPDPEGLLEAIGRFEVEVGPVRSLGAMAAGERRVVEITGGRAAGLLAGEILPGGADWQWLRSDGITEISAHYVVQTDAGALVEIHSDGYRHGPAQVMARLAAGAAVDRSEYYFRTALRFALVSADPRLARLNGLLGVGVGQRQAGRVLLDIFTLR